MIQQFKTALAAARDADADVESLKARIDETDDRREAMIEEMAADDCDHSTATSSVVGADVAVEVLSQKLQRATLAATQAWLAVADLRGPVLRSLKPEAESIRDEGQQVAEYLAASPVAEPYRGPNSVIVSRLASISQLGVFVGRFTQAIHDMGQQPGGDVAKLRKDENVEAVKRWAGYFDGCLDRYQGGLASIEAELPKARKAAEAIRAELEK